MSSRATACNRPIPGPPDRAPRAVVVMDYQNVHLTANELFGIDGEPAHKTLIHPLHYGQTAVQARNANLKDDSVEHAELAKVICFRGQPVPKFEPENYRRTSAQGSRWAASDHRVKVVFRPLKYVTRTTGYSSENGPILEVISKVEKGIDVLCATTVLTEAMRPNVDLVLLASQDTDLAPCLDAALDHGSARIETLQWWCPEVAVVGHLRPPSGRRIWNTRLGRDDFESTRDWNIY